MRPPITLSILLVSVGSVLGLSTEPFLSSPGDPTILVFLDIHKSFHGNACTEPNWNNMNVAFSLYWKSEQNNITGIEIFDTCMSSRRTASILKDRLLTSTCNSSATQVSGVISYSSNEVNEVISSFVDSVHVVVRDIRNYESKAAENTLYVDLPAYSNIPILVEVLAFYNWSYISVIADDDPISQIEYLAFLDTVKDADVCLSITNTESYKVQLTKLTQLTNREPAGVVLFTSDMNHVSEVANVTGEAPLVIFTHNTQLDSFQFINRGLILTDVYENDSSFAEFMSENIWQMQVPDFVDSYFLNEFNCSRHQNSSITCNHTENIREHFQDISLSYILRVFDEVYGLMSEITISLIETNCTKYYKSCFDDIMITGSQRYSGVQNKTLVSKPPHEIQLTTYGTGNMTWSTKLSILNMENLKEEVKQSLSNYPAEFPHSTCSDWCPACYMTSCRSSIEEGRKFNGDYLYIPGDLNIVGLVPFSSQWNRLESTVCSGLRTADKLDILSEAFLYAIKTVKERYPNILDNVALGALLFDTCSDMNRLSQVMLNFESCKYNIGQSNWELQPYPYQTPVYVVLDYDSTHSKVLEETTSLGKLALGVSPSGSVYKSSGIVYDSNGYNFEALTSMLHEMNWVYIGVISSKDANLEGLYKTAEAKNICISYHSKITSQATDVSLVLNTVSSSSANAVVVFATAAEVNALFVALTSRSVLKTWILIETRHNWLEINSHPLPLGTVVLERLGKQNEGFNSHIGQDLELDTESNIFQKFREARLDRNENSDQLDDVTAMQAADVIQTVDMSLLVLDQVVKNICGEGRLCSEFLKNGTNDVMNRLNTGQFEYQRDIVKMSTQSSPTEGYVIKNLHETGFKQVGEWLDGSLTLFKDKFISYNIQNTELDTVRVSKCYTPPCFCSNINDTTDERETTKTKTLDHEMGYVDTTAEFQTELWKIIVVIIAGSGALLTLILLVYILCKVCSGRLMRRYLVIGIPMLFAMLFLFLSVLPFVFTPDEWVCGMRYFAHGFSYALCFSTLLAKMMSLRDFKMVGLGGNVSKVNQLFGILFMTSVQVAIGVQWWVLRTPVVFTEILTEQVQDALTQTTYYACDFTRRDFIAYHTYVIFLVVLCCLYSLSIRREAKGYKDVSARVLTICSWFCLVLWIAIIVTLLVLDRDLLEAVCSVGLLANALSVLVIVFLPTVSAISRLKYDVTDGKRKENGYKLDPDFQFERPYSLPGTLHTSLTDKNLTYPRSLATFDTSLSY